MEREGADRSPAHDELHARTDHHASPHTAAKTYHSHLDLESQQWLDQDHAGVDQKQLHWKRPEQYQFQNESEQSQPDLHPQHQTVHLQHQRVHPFAPGLEVWA
jgi:hypothetical protein